MTGAAARANLPAVVAALPPVAAPADNRQRAYAEWYSWALSHLGPEPARAHAAAKAMLDVFERGGDQGMAMQAGSAAAAAPPPPDPAQARTRSYAEWFSWAQATLKADFSRAHAAAAAAQQASDAGQPPAAAAQAAVAALGPPGLPTYAPARPAPAGGGLLWQFSGPAIWPLVMGLVAIVVPIFTTFYFPILPIFGAIGAWRAIQRGRLFGGVAGIVLNVLGGLMSLLASGLLGR